MLIDKIIHWVSLHIGAFGFAWMIFDKMGWTTIIIKKINKKLNIKIE